MISLMTAVMVLMSLKIVENSIVNLASFNARTANACIQLKYVTIRMIVEMEVTKKHAMNMIVSRTSLNAQVPILQAHFASSLIRNVTK